jgi:small subunit ribosomal protein S6
MWFIDRDTQHNSNAAPRHMQEQHLATTLRDYELMVILSPEVGDDVINESLERLNQGVTSRGGEVVDVNHWGRRRLAYPINRHLEGNYVVSQIKLDPAEVPGLEGSLRISEEVIRHMIVKAGE